MARSLGLAGHQGVGLRLGLAGHVPADDGAADLHRRNPAQHRQEAFRRVASGGLALPGHGIVPPKWRNGRSRPSQRTDEAGGRAWPKDLERRLVRTGGHWHHFLVKYPESNRMHKMMVALATLSRTRGDPPKHAGRLAAPSATTPTARRVWWALSPDLRNAIWRQLAIAERVLPARASRSRMKSSISITTATRSCGSTPRSSPP